MVRFVVVGHIDWSSLDSITRGLLHAVRGAGCQVTSVAWSVGGIQCGCPSVAAKVQLLNEIGRLCAQDPEIASLALHFRRAWPSDADFAAAVVAWCQKHIRWIDEPGERFQLARLTATSRIGDCDCSSILVMAILLAAGINARVVGLQDPETGVGMHACSQAELPARGGRKWTWTEASVRDVPIGTDPRTLMGSTVHRPAGAT